MTRSLPDTVQAAAGEQATVTCTLAPEDRRGGRTSFTPTCRLGAVHPPSATVATARDREGRPDGTAAPVLVALGLVGLDWGALGRVARGWLVVARGRVGRDERVLAGVCGAVPPVDGRGWAVTVDEVAPADGEAS
jgi:hypothetical protein